MLDKIKNLNLFRKIPKLDIILKKIIPQKIAFGLDISDTSIEVVQLQKANGKISLVSSNLIHLEEGVVQEGEIINKPKIIEAIKKALTTAKPVKIDTEFLVSAIPDSKIFIHIFELKPNLKESEIKNLINYEAQGVIPVPLKKLYYDFKIIKQDDEKTEVFYVAAPINIVDDYLDVFKKCNLNILALDTESESLARALLKNFQSSEAVVILDMGARTSVINIFDQNGIRSSIDSNIAGNEITRRISQKMNLALPEAENFKKSYGLDSTKEKGRIMLIIQSALQEIIEELSDSINYYEQKSKKKISKIILTGGTSQIPNLLDYFKSNFTDKIVEYGKPWFMKKEIKKMPFISQTAVGLALRASSTKNLRDGINLLPIESKEIPLPIEESHEDVNKRLILSRLEDKKNQKLIAAFVILMIMFISGAVFAYRQYKNEVATTRPEKKEVTADQSTSTFEVILDTTRKDPSKVPATLLESTIEKVKKYSSDGQTKKVKSVATGTAIVYNNRSFEQTLVATTRLLTEKDVLYRIKNEIDIPPKETREVEIYSDKPGSEYEIGPSSFTVPGLNATLQKYVYAKSTEATSGGEKEVTIITEEDIKNAKEQLTEEVNQSSSEELSSTILDQWEEELSTDEKLIPNLINFELTEVSTTQKAGDEAENIETKAKIKLKGVKFDETKVEQLAKIDLSEKLPGDIETDYFIETNYNFEKFENNLVYLTVTAKAISSI